MAYSTDSKTGLACGDPTGKYLQVLEGLSADERERFERNVSLFMNHQAFPPCPDNMTKPKGCSMGFLGNCKTSQVRNFCGGCSVTAGEIVSVCFTCKPLHGILVNPKLVRLFCMDTTDAPEPSKPAHSAEHVKPASAAADDQLTTRVLATMEKLRAEFDDNERTDGNFKHPLVSMYESYDDIDNFVRFHLKTPIALECPWNYDDNYPEQTLRTLILSVAATQEHLTQLHDQAVENAIARGREYFKTKHLKDDRYDVHKISQWFHSQEESRTNGTHDGSKPPHSIYRKLWAYVKYLNSNSSDAALEAFNLQQLEGERDHAAKQVEKDELKAELQQASLERLASRQLAMIDISNFNWLHKQHTYNLTVDVSELNQRAIDERQRFYIRYQSAIDFYADPANADARAKAEEDGLAAHQKFLADANFTTEQFAAHVLAPDRKRRFTHMLKTVANLRASTDTYNSVIPDKFAVDDEHPEPVAAAGSS